MQKNGGRIGENYEEIKKKMNTKFLTERICRYKECPKMVKEAGEYLKRNIILW